MNDTQRQGKRISEARGLGVAVAAAFRTAGVLLCLVASAASGELAERVVVVSNMADLRIKLVDHLADERWRVRTGCVSTSPTRVQVVPAFEDLRVKVVRISGGRTICLTPRRPVLRED